MLTLLVSPDPDAEERGPSTKGAEAGAEVGGGEAGRVYSFYGLLELEKDPDVSDGVKIAEWEAFVRRTEQQLSYAREAVQRWENAARRRAIERALSLESDEAVAFPRRVEAWLEAAAAQRGGEARRKAEKRAAYWTAEHTRALVERAKSVEQDGRPKAERIAAWKEVVAWQKEGEAAQAAASRMRALRDQLFVEAEALDRVTGVDAATKLEAWQDVLRGYPTSLQEKKARARIEALSSE